MEQFTIGQIHLLPPTNGRCPVCAATHAPEKPHMVNSLWYQMRFRQDHGRFATWADATRHCDDRVLGEILRKAQKGGWLITDGNNDGAWISVKKRLPTAEDADSQGCVLAWHIFQGLMLVGWHQIRDNRFMVYWQRPIAPPKDAAELRKAWDDTMEAQFQAAKK